MKLKDFAMLCARNFGVLIRMRDEPLTAPIPEKLEVDECCKKELEYAQKKYDDFLAMSDTERMDYLERTYTETVESINNETSSLGSEKDVLRRRYNAMLLKVIKWNPPTPEHVNLREFMIKQIHDSIEWDCSEYKPTIPDKAEWCNVEKHINGLKESLDYAKQSYDREVKYIESCNKWLSDLRESLKDCD